ncbi:MAG TPA: DUF3667 domain-containing protein [Thermoanaerobaculia bacterium]|nr:DUF3667 domain-containing protein [Thermoanaerobaculia bacterium]
MSHFVHELTHEILHVDSKLFTTLRLLMTKPGQLTADYFGGRRSRAIGPLRLFLVIFALQFLFLALLPSTSVFRVQNIEKAKPEITGSLEDVAAMKHMTTDEYREQLNEKWSHTIKLLELIEVVLAGAFLSLLYRQRHLVEHFVFAAHFFSFTYLVQIITLPLRYYTGLTGPASTALTTASVIIGVIYMSLAMKRFYERGEKLPWVRGAVGYGFTFLAQGALMMFTIAYAMFAVTRH